MNHWPLGFRPILRSLVMADGWARRRGVNPRAVEPWPEAFLTVAEACAAGKEVSADIWQSAWAMIQPATAQEQEFVTLILATPILLMNVNSYGHRRLAVQDWGETLGLGPSTLLALDDYFQQLGRGQAITPLSGEHHPWERSGRLFPDVADLGALVTSLPGQWLLPLTLAHRWEWPVTALALVGVLATVQAGPGGMPLQASEHFMREALRDDGGQGLGPRWRGYGTSDIDALADALHQRWAGRPPAP